ncbi:MAG: hypothetical protein KF914_10955 [Rhizobiaceae bacterium]|nr:hypothetical protein [Rhizobiaceae bacterium]
MKKDSAGGSPELNTDRDVDVARVSLNLGAFRPNERDEVEALMITDVGRRIVAAAVAEHLEGWKRGDWLDRPYIERLGNWFGRKAPPAMLSQLNKIAGSDPHPAYVAFATGMGRSSLASDGAGSSDYRHMAAAV